MKRLLSVIMACVLLMGLASCAISESELNYDQAIEKLNALMGKIDVNKPVHQPDPSWIGNEGSINDLPPIDKYPLSVEGRAEINVEIFSSTEKSNVKNDSWMEVMAKQFNAAGHTVNGRTVAVSVRPIASGLALDYIRTRTYVPPAYTPANELWGDMIKSTGVDIELVEKRLTGNTAGVLLRKDIYDTYSAKYGEVTMEKVVEAVLNGDVVLGHTDPNVSSTGLNILARELKALDPNNPFSSTAVEKFRLFQSLIPPASPTTAEMIKVAEKGILNAMIMESQAWSTEPKVSDWKFTPMGVRHDSPMYVLEGISEDQRTALKLFVDHCKNGQNSAGSFGFNKLDEFGGENLGFSGKELFSVQEFWKENKDGGDPVVSVFVIDVSGSMDGTKIVETKKALRNSMQYINESNYVGLVSYSSPDQIAADVPISQFDAAQQALFAGAVNDLKIGGSTATNSAIVVALDMLMKAKEAIPNAKLRVLVFSDGEQMGGLSLSSILGIVNGLAVPIYGIGFESPDLRDLQTLADINEGYTINADSEDVAYKLRGLFTKEL